MTKDIKDTRNEVWISVKKSQGRGPQDVIVDTEISLKSIDSLDDIIGKTLNLRKELENK